MLSTIAFVFVLGVLVLVHELGHFLVAKLLKVRVETFSFGFGKKLLSLKRADTEYCISLIPLGGYVKLAGDNPEEKREEKEWEFLSKSVEARAAIVLAGPVFNYIIAFIFFSLIFLVGYPSKTSKIGEVKENYPAKESGLQKDDRVISIDGKEVKLWDDLSALIHSKVSGGAVNLQIQRQGRLLNVAVVPKIEEVNTIFGEKSKIGLIGIGPSEETQIVRYSLPQAMYQGANRVIILTKMTYFALYKMAVGKMSVRDSLAGPVVIFQITGEAAKSGFIYVLQIMAALSVSLAIINLFPVPVLDGGHLLFLILEKIKGKPVSIKAQEIAARVGFSMLMVLMCFVFYNDLARLGIFEKVFNFFVKK